MTPRIRTRIVGRTFLLAFILMLGIAANTQPSAACSDTAARYPMLIDSGYEGEPCEFADASCPDPPVRYPMLIGSGYEGASCSLATATHVDDTAARTTNLTWHETKLDGFGYESTVIEATLSRQDRD